MNKLKLKEETFIYFYSHFSEKMAKMLIEYLFIQNIHYRNKCFKFT